MNIDDFVRHFEGAVDDVAAGSLNPQTRFRDLSQWSSLVALNIIAMVDTEYGVELSVEELRKCQSIEELFQLLSGKKK
ncbi:MAG: acyl carrier protein [Verrucomicrobiota bacterium]|jgi:acyl carrier protein